MKLRVLVLTSIFFGNISFGMLSNPNSILIDWSEFYSISAIDEQFEESTQFLYYLWTLQFRMTAVTSQIWQMIRKNDHQSRHFRYFPQNCWIINKRQLITQFIECSKLRAKRFLENSNWENWKMMKHWESKEQSAVITTRGLLSSSTRTVWSSLALKRCNGKCETISSTVTSCQELLSESKQVNAG